MIEFIEEEHQDQGPNLHKTFSLSVRKQQNSMFLVTAIFLTDTHAVFFFMILNTMNIMRYKIIGDLIRVTIVHTT